MSEGMAAELAECAGGLQCAVDDLERITRSAAVTQAEHDELLVLAAMIVMVRRGVLDRALAAVRDEAPT